MLTAQRLLALPPEEIRTLIPGALGFRPITEAEVRHILKATDAFWLHSGDPAQPHAELTSGLCSDGFVDVLRTLRYTNLCELIAEELIDRLTDEMSLREVGWVVGSDHAGAALSYEVARQLMVMHDFTEKGPDGTQIWKRFQIEPNSVVLQIEDLITTTKTVSAVRRGIQRGNDALVDFAPYIGVVVNRSGETTIEGSRIVALTTLTIQTWEPGDCPLCAVGSKRLRPKQHWAELTGA